MTARSSESFLHCRQAVGREESLTTTLLYMGGSQTWRDSQEYVFGDSMGNALRSAHMRVRVGGLGPSRTPSRNPFSANYRRVASRSAISETLNSTSEILNAES